jgi:hypothetical protein
MRLAAIHRYSRDQIMQIGTDWTQVGKYKSSYDRGVESVGYFPIFVGTVNLVVSTACRVGHLVIS